MIPITSATVEGRRHTGCAVASADRWRPIAQEGLPVELWLPDPVSPGWGLPCEGQLVAVPRDRYDWIYLLAEGELAEGEVWLHYEQAIDPEWLGVIGGFPLGQLLRLPVTRSETLCALRLPVAAMRILTVTCVCADSAGAAV